MVEQLSDDQIKAKVEQYEHNAESGISNQADWQKLKPEDRKRVFLMSEKMHPGKAGLPHLEFTYDSEGPHLKEQSGVASVDKTEEQKAHETFTKIQQGSQKAEDLIDAVSKIKPEEQRQLVLREMKEHASDFGNVVIKPVFPGQASSPLEVEKRAEPYKPDPKLEAEWKADAEALERKTLAHPEVEAQKIEALGKTAALDNEKDPTQNKARLDVRKEFDRLRQMRESGTPEQKEYAEKVIGLLQKDGIKFGTDSQGRRTVTFTGWFESKDAIPIDVPLEQQKQEAKTAFDRTAPIAIAISMKPDVEATQREANREAGVGDQKGGYPPRWWTLEQ